MPYVLSSVVQHMFETVTFLWHRATFENNYTTLWPRIWACPQEFLQFFVTVPLKEGGAYPSFLEYLVLGNSRQSVIIGYILYEQPPKMLKVQTSQMSIPPACCLKKYNDQAAQKLRRLPSTISHHGGSNISQQVYIVQSHSFSPIQGETPTNSAACVFWTTDDTTNCTVSMFRNNPYEPRKKQSSYCSIQQTYQNSCRATP